MPGGMPWVKIYTETLDDPKVAKLPDAAMWRFIQLILVAAECDAGGAFVVGDEAMTLDDIAWRLRINKDALNSDMKILLSAGIVTKSGKVFEIPKFEERQGPAQKEKRATWNERQQKRRERVTRDSQVSHALEESREDIEREEDKGEPPPAIFVEKNLVEYQNTFEKDTGITSYRIDQAVEVWSKMQADGVTPQDMHQGTQELLHSDRTYTLVRPQSVMNAAYTAKQKRIYESGKKLTPKREIKILPDGSQIEVDIMEANK